jgi:hypothetical protein
LSGFGGAASGVFSGGLSGTFTSSACDDGRKKVSRARIATERANERTENMNRIPSPAGSARKLRVRVSVSRSENFYRVTAEGFSPPARARRALHGSLWSRKPVKALIGRSSDFRIVLPVALPAFVKESSGLQRVVPGNSGDHRDGFTPSSLLCLRMDRHTEKGLRTNCCR